MIIVYLNAKAATDIVGCKAALFAKKVSGCVVIHRLRRHRPHFFFSTTWRHFQRNTTPRAFHIREKYSTGTVIQRLSPSTPSRYPPRATSVDYLANLDSLNVNLVTTCRGVAPEVASCRWKMRPSRTQPVFGHSRCGAGLFPLFMLQVNVFDDWLRFHVQWNPHNGFWCVKGGNAMAVFALQWQSYSA